MRREREERSEIAKKKPPRTEVLSARGRQTLAGGQNGRGDVSKGKVFGRAAGPLLPIQKQLAVAVGQAGGGVDVKLGQGSIDPLRGAFKFGVGANRGLVDDEMRGGIGVDADQMGPHGAIFFVNKDGEIAELLEDRRDGTALGNDRFGLDADLVACSVDGVQLVGLALVRHRAQAAVLADAQNLAAAAEIACGSVVKSVVLVGAGGVEMEAEMRKAGLESLWIGNGELQFDLGSLHA
jgi:hypothetical protein